MLKNCINSWCNNVYCVKPVEQISVMDSKKSDMIQLSDNICGAISRQWNSRDKVFLNETPKDHYVKHICSKLNRTGLWQTYPNSEKLNIWNFKYVTENPND